jgi:hypothetical protein
VLGTEALDVFVAQKHRKYWFSVISIGTGDKKINWFFCIFLYFFMPNIALFF